jgi:hypothetical protein
VPLLVLSTEKLGHSITVVGITDGNCEGFLVSCNEGMVDGMMDGICEGLTDGN